MSEWSRMDMCLWDETGLKPCEEHAMDCFDCDYYENSEEEE